MSTRSFIGVKQPDESVLRIYCHYDSYNNFKILTENYNTFESAMKLIQLGNMLHLKPTIDECYFYSQNKGEDFKNNKAKHFKSLKEYRKSNFNTAGLSYTFLFDGKEWLWSLMK